MWDGFIQNQTNIQPKNECCEGVLILNDETPTQETLGTFLIVCGFVLLKKYSFEITNIKVLMPF